MVVGVICFLFRPLLEGNPASIQALLSVFRFGRQPSCSTSDIFVLRHETVAKPVQRTSEPTRLTFLSVGVFVRDPESELFPCRKVAKANTAVCAVGGRCGHSAMFCCCCCLHHKTVTVPVSVSLYLHWSTETRTPYLPRSQRHDKKKMLIIY